MNAPFKTDALPEWNLADLYVGRDDPRIELDLAAAKAANDELASLEGLFLQARGEPERLGLLIDRGIIVTDTTQAELAARTPTGRLDDAFHALTRTDPSVGEKAA